MSFVVPIQPPSATPGLCVSHLLAHADFPRRGNGNLTISATERASPPFVIYVRFVAKIHLQSDILEGRNAYASRYGRWEGKKRPQPPLGKLRPIILARTYSHTECYRTTIGGWGLNERVRNGNGCFPPPMFTRVTLTFSRVTGGRLHVLLVMVRV